MKLPRYYEDMTVFRDKAAGARSRFFAYGDEDAALLGDVSLSDRVISLDGEFYFGYYTSLARVPEKIVSPTTDLSVLAKIMLPSDVKSIMEYDEVFDMPLFPPHVPADSPVAVFVKDVELFSDSFRKYIVFEGAGSALYLFVNGEYAGFSEVSSAMHEFDITDLVKEGTNRIAVVVLKNCDGSYLENSGSYFGIVGSSYIMLRPKGHIRDLLVTTSLSEDCTKGFVTATVDAVVFSSMTLSLYSPKGELLGTEQPDSDGVALFSVDSPHFYNAENPELYTLLMHFAGEYIPLKVGIRELKWESDGLIYNKKRITLRPVLYGKTLRSDGRPMTEADYIKDLSTLKRHSVNTIVTKGRPLLPVFYELCDRLGFYVVNTADIDVSLLEAQFPAMISTSNEWEGAVYNRANLLTARDKNHSSVIAWSFDGSVTAGKNIIFTAQHIRKLDKMRAVHYANDGKGGFPEGLIDFEHLPLFDGRFESKELSSVIKARNKPVSINALDLEGGRFEIINNLDFSYISGIEILYELSVFGKAVTSKSLGIMTLAPRKSAEFMLELDLPKDGDTALKFTYKNLYDGELLSDGATLGFDCFEIKRPYRHTEKALPQKGLSLKEFDDRFEVSGSEFSLIFDRTKGYITSLSKKGRPVCGDIRPSVFLAGEAPSVGCDERIVCADSEAGTLPSGKVGISATVVIAQNSLPHHILVSFDYEINAAGEVTVKYTLTRDSEIEGVSRVGFDAFFKDDFSLAEYYCLGPVSLKGDEEFGFLGRFKEQIRPSEHTHHHSKTRFAAVYDSNRSGVIFYKKDDEFSFFVNTRSQHALERGGQSEGNVLSVNPSLQKGILTEQKIKGCISFKPIDADDGSLWGNATAIYKAASSAGKEEN